MPIRQQIIRMHFYALLNNGSLLAVLSKHQRVKRCFPLYYYYYYLRILPGHIPAQITLGNDLEFSSWSLTTELSFSRSTSIFVDSQSLTRCFWFRNSSGNIILNNVPYKKKSLLISYIIRTQSEQGRTDASETCGCFIIGNDGEPVQQ